MDTEGLSLICAGLGIAEEDDNGNRIGYSRGQYCLDNLKDLLRFLRRDDPHTRDVFKQVCKWNIVSKDLIPIIEHCQDDRNLVLNAVKVLVFLTMPIEPTSKDISQQLEYLWGLKSSVTCSDIVAVIVSLLESPLENLESETFTEDDWKLVQLVLSLFRNVLAIQEVPLQQKAGGCASQFLSLRERFLELLFRENVMDLIIVITQHVGGSYGYFRQDNLLLLEIFHYIFMGQEPELTAKAHLKGFKGLELEMLTISGAQRGRDKRSLNSKKPLLMTTVGSLRGGAKIRIAAIGKEFTAATKLVIENDFNQSNLPEFIGSLSNLKHLDLSWTNLSGPISHQLENLSHLQFLNLLGNDLIIIENLEWLSHLPSIEYLDLTSINLSVVNDWLEVVSHLSNLTTLNLWGCDLPSQMFSSLSGFNYWKSLTSLESLNLNPNKLVSLPKPIGDICTLRKLYFFFNNANAQLVELVNNLSRYAKDSLEDLGLSYNQLTGSLPNFTLFPSLKYLGLSNNILNGTVPKSIGSLYKLEWLDMSSNFLQGTMSEAHFSNLSKLRYLDLSSNSLALEFNFNWVPPFQLKKIYLTSCKLGPRFPSWIQTQRNVSILKISNAEISDTVPIEWFADLPPTLEFLDLSRN
nr:receptor-like protein EIX2 [Quercus suber]